MHTVAITIGVSIMMQLSKLLQEDNCIIITSNWRVWWSLN